MVIDSLDNASYYYKMHKRFETAFDFLKTINFKSCSNGTFEVDGNNIKCIISSNELKSKEDAILETHKKYIDIQIPLSQAETFGWKSSETLNKSIDGYDVEKDLELFDDKPSSYFTLLPEEFAIFFPQDGHAPLIGDGEIKKIIFKILVD